MDTCGPPERPVTTLTPRLPRFQATGQSGSIRIRRGEFFLLTEAD